MNRVNFADCSGVIIDVCHDHGTWFDRDELRRVIEFIRAGGMDLARDKKRAVLVAEQQRLRRLREGRAAGVFDPDAEIQPLAITSARDLARLIFRSVG